MSRKVELQLLQAQAQRYHKEVCEPRGCEKLYKTAELYRCLIRKPRQVVTDFGGFGNCNRAMVNGVNTTIRIVQTREGQP